MGVPVLFYISVFNIMPLSTNTEAKGVLVKVMMQRLCFLFLLLLSSLATAEKYALLVGTPTADFDVCQD